MDNAYSKPLSPDIIRDQGILNGITNCILDMLLGPKVTAEQIADAAYRETEDVPTFTPAEKFEVMLARINRVWSGDMKDDFAAEVIKACRVRAGL